MTGLSTMIDEGDDAAEQHAEPGDLGDDRAAALAERPAVADRPAELLLEGEEEPRGEGERGEPQRRDRLELVVAADRDVPTLKNA